jgi:GNAT superfamily N-acetyltransferase
VQIRPAGPGDGALLERLASRRWADLEAAAPGLAEMQDRAQRRECGAVPGSAGEHVVLVDDVPVGRAWWADDASERWILDLAMIPEAQQRGIGSQLVAQLVAGAGGRRVRLRVEHRSARWRAHLERCGFLAVATDEFGTTLVLEPGGSLEAARS